MWKTARTFADLQRLSAAFIRGDELEHFAHVGTLNALDGLGRVALRSLAASWFVTVIDPQWGRDAYLWEQTVQVVTRAGIPASRWQIRRSRHTCKES